MSWAPPSCLSGWLILAQAGRCPGDSQRFSTGAPHRTLAWLPHRTMRQTILNSKRRHILASVLLAMLVFRAYVPVGFMPASGVPFLLELCPAASSMPMPAHHHHGGAAHGHFENCPFGSAPAAGPISQTVAFDAGTQAVAHDVVVFASLPFTVQAHRSHRPRGPPLLV
jgi:hypothetical protein